MDQVNTYKYLSIVLAITALVFAYLYFTKPPPTLSGVYENIGNDLESCSEGLASWKEDYGSEASSTAKQAALDAVLADCQAGLSESKDSLD